MGTATQPNTAVRAEQLQFLRFLAFLNVFIYHAEAWNFFGYPATQCAKLAVCFFFTLSGFVTGFSGYGKERRPTLRAVGGSMVKRLRSIYPLYFLTMILPLLDVPIPELIAAGDYAGLKARLTPMVLNLLMLQSWSPQYLFSYNFVGWFMSSLMFLTLFNLPVVWLLNKANRSARRYWIFAGGILAAVFCETLFCGLVRYSDLGYWQYGFPPARLGEYLAGILFGFALRAFMETPNFLERLPRWLFTGAELAALALCWWYLGWFGPYWIRQSVHWLPPVMILLGVFTLGKGWISQLFRAKPLVWLGDISFGCYLIHELVVMPYEIQHGIAAQSVPGQIAAFTLCLGITILAAALTHRPRK